MEIAAEGVNVGVVANTVVIEVTLVPLIRIGIVEEAADRIHVRRSATVGANATIKTPKSGRVRSVPMVPQIATALARLGQREQFAGPDDLVFPNQVGDTLGGVDGFDQPMHKIIVYQRPLEEDFPNPDELRLEIRKTVIHELAHHFGTVGYEVLTSLGRRYARIYKGGEAKSEKDGAEKSVSAAATPPA